MMVLEEIWKASNPKVPLETPRGWKKQGPASPVIAWGVFFLIAFTLVCAAFGVGLSSKENPRQGLTTAAYLGLGAEAAAIISGNLFLYVIANIQHQQKKKLKLLRALDEDRSGTSLPAGGPGQRLEAASASSFAETLQGPGRPIPPPEPQRPARFRYEEDEQEYDRRPPRRYRHEVELPWLDQQFTTTSMVVLVLFSILCGGIAFLFGLIGSLGCQDSKARGNAIVVLIISSIWIGLAVLIGVLGAK